jgi:hypothetical protein
MNYPKDPNDWYFFLAAGCSALGCGVAKNFPLPDWTVQAGFWIPQLFAATALVRWVGASVWSDVDRARTLLSMRLQNETSQDERKEPAASFTAIDRSELSAMITNPQIVELPKLNIQTHFFTCILRSYDLDPIRQSQVDMTETLWVKQRGMFAQIPFRVMKDRAVDCGAFKRKNSNKNAPYIVASRNMLVWLASGNPLPAHPPPH